MPRTRSVSAARLRGSMQAPQGGRRGFRRGRNLPASARRHDGQTVCLCTFYVVAPPWVLCVLATPLVEYQADVSVIYQSDHDMTISSRISLI